MKTPLQWVVLGTWFVAGVAQGLAADTTKTNWVQNFNFTLTAWVQGQSKPVRITTKDLITHLGGVWVTNRPTSPGGPPEVTQLPTFTSGKLLTWQPFGDTNAQVLVRVGSGKQFTDYNVSSAFVPPADVPRYAPTYFVTAAGLTNTHSLATFTLSANNFAFVLQGLSASSDTKVNSSGVTMMKSMTSTVAGLCQVGSEIYLTEGKVTCSGSHLE